MKRWQRLKNQDYLSVLRLWYTSTATKSAVAASYLRISNFYGGVFGEINHHVLEKMACVTKKFNQRCSLRRKNALKLPFSSIKEKFLVSRTREVLLFTASRPESESNTKRVTNREKMVSQRRTSSGRRKIQAKIPCRSHGKREDKTGLLPYHTIW